MTDVELLKICQADGDTIELNVADQEERFTDAITGQALKPDLVRAARREEMEYFAAKRVYKKIPRRMAMERQGEPPIRCSRCYASSCPIAMHAHGLLSLARHFANRSRFKRVLLPVTRERVTAVARSTGRSGPAGAL